MLKKTYLPEIVPTSFSDRSDDNHQNWVKSTFKYKGRENKHGLFEHQRIVRDYMQMTTPYRGILLYHGLGSGKTLSSIAISEVFVNEKDVIVMLPATLLNNYYEEIYKFGNEMYIKQRHWTKTAEGWKSSNTKDANYSSLSHIAKAEVDKTIKDLIAERITFIKYNGVTTKRMKEMVSKQLETGKNMFDNKVVIIDEVHNFISRVTNGSSVSKYFYKMMMNAERTKLVCLSGTPLINYAQEFTLLINLITGFIETYTLRCLKKSFQKIEGLAEIMKNDPHVRTYESNDDKNDIIVTLIPDGFVKTPDGKLKIKESAKHTIESVITNLDVGLKTNGVVFKKVMALPLKEKDLLKQMRILADESDPNYQEVLQYFTDATKGLVSYYYYNDPSLFPKLGAMKVVNVKLSDSQFSYYKQARMIEHPEENPDDKFYKKKISRKMFDNIDFTKLQAEFFLFKLYSRICSNFITPGIVKLKNKKKVDGSKLFKAALDQGFLEPSSLKEYAPKIGKIMKNLENANGPALIYSQYRVIEGLGAVAAVLSRSGYSEINIQKVKGEMRIQTDRNASKHFIVFSNTDQQRMQILMDIFNKNWSNLPQSVANDAKDIQVDVILITQAGSEGISLKGVRQVHMLEPYWNYVRVSQVIGRAARAKSHLHLPVDQQRVDVFMYLASLTDKQKEIMYWDEGKLSVKGKTSDEIIFEIAKRKDRMLGTLLTIMKETAMDCKVHLKKHLKIDPATKCLN